MRLNPTVSKVNFHLKYSIQHYHSFFTSLEPSSSCHTTQWWRWKNRQWEKKRRQKEWKLNEIFVRGVDVHVGIASVKYNKWFKFEIFMRNFLFLSSNFLFSSSHSVSGLVLFFEEYNDMKWKYVSCVLEIYIHKNGIRRWIIMKP